MDAILGYHLNPLTCGIARFNRALGLEMDLQVVPMFSEEARRIDSPLLSIKVAEMRPAAIDRLEEIANDPDYWPNLRLFLHQHTGTDVENALLARARTIYCGNAEIFAELSPRYAHVVRAWCPGYLFEKRMMPRDAAIKCYTFGMAHKLRVDYYRELKDLLDKTGQTYAIYISAAVHEDTSLDDSFTAAYEELYKIFGDNVFFLGFISDAALYTHLVEATYFVAFFKGGVRDNNTSVNTAMQCGAVVLTNLDESSPASFRHGETVLDIGQMSDALPWRREELAAIADKAKVLAEQQGWAPLGALLREHD